MWPPITYDVVRTLYSDVKRVLSLVDGEEPAGGSHWSEAQVAGGSHWSEAQVAGREGLPLRAREITAHITTHARKTR
jgi:hypothetical protein